MDGVRHYRVRIKSPIPNFLRFGRAQIFLRYDGQQRTCSHCNQTGHMASACYSEVCFNCDQVGHLASACQTATLCNICKSVDHKAKDCPLSWAREVSADNSDNKENDANGTEPENGNLEGENPHSASVNTADASGPSETPPGSDLEINTEENPDVTKEDTDENPDVTTKKPVKQIPSKQPADASSQISVPGDFPFESEEDDFKSIPEDEMESATSGDSMSEDEGTETSQPTEETSSPKELPQRTQTPCGARRPAKMPDVNIPLRQPTQPTLVTPKSKDTSAENSTEANPNPDENTQQLFPNTGEPTASKRKKSDHLKKHRPKKKK